MRFHILTLFHTVTSEEQVACAFTQKVVKFIKMMQPTEEQKQLKKRLTVDEITRHKTVHELIHYGHEDSIVDVDEHVTVTTKETMRIAYGDHDWRKDFFKFAVGDFADMTARANTMVELKKRKHPGDFILCFWGLGNKPVADMFADECIIVEPGVGYTNVSSFAPNKVFESYAVMHNNYGLSGVFHPSCNDVVIPNYFDLKDFDFKTEKKDYFLYIGRIATIKGVEMMIWLAKKLGFRLIIAGQGLLERDIGAEGTNLPSNIEYHGFADIEKRKRLMSNAKCLFLCTKYIEPFGGTSMEAMMSGTPVITSDFGVFAETVIHGVTGYRCHTGDQYEWAINNIHKISPQACRDWAMKNYSLGRIRLMYEEYFDQMIKYKFHNGFYADDIERTELDWLVKEYPDTSMFVPTIKPRIAILTETKWAFGRITSGLQKYSKKFEVRVFDWNNMNHPTYTIKAERLDKFDVIYTTIWDLTRDFEKRWPELKHKMVYSGHGLAEFIKQKFSSTSNLEITNQDIDEFVVDPELIEWINNRKTPMSVVSHELFDRLSSLDDFNPSKLRVTPYGVDTEAFFVDKTPRVEETDGKLRVLFTFPENSAPKISSYGYDQKRKTLLMKIRDKIVNDDLPIRIIFPDDSVHISQMPAFYRKGDVFLMISHSEGGPLGVLESGASGLVAVATKVGEAPFNIIEDETGFLIDNGNDEQIMEDVIDRLTLLANDREKLQRMKNNAVANAQKNWSWEHKIDAWDNFFETCMNIIKTQ